MKRLRIGTASVLWSLIGVVSVVCLDAYTLWPFRGAPSFDARTIEVGHNVYPVVVLGAGPGGMTAALYSVLANIQTLVLQGPTPGGLITQSHSVRNWPGAFDVAGHELTDKMIEQIKKRGVTMAAQSATAVDFTSWPYTITAQGDDDTTHTYKALSVIIATGAQNRLLGIPGEKEYWSKGVSNCAVCDGGLYQDKDVVIVGGGDSAMVEAAYLARIARSVTVLVRSDKLRAQDSRKDEVLKLPNVTVRYNTKVTKITGDGEGVTGISLLSTAINKLEDFSTDAVFLAIGFDPRTQLVAGKLDRDKQGYIKVSEHQQTSRAGVFAVGDVVDPIFKQAITAAGDGCKAALMAHEFLMAAHYEPKAYSEQHAEQVGEERVASIEEPQVSRSDVWTSPRSLGAGVSFQRDVLQSELPVLVDFYASWCGPCRRLAPHLNQIAKQYAGRLRVVKVNIDAHKALKNRYGVRGIPAIKFFKNGSVVHSLTGYKGLVALRAAVDRVIG